MLADDAIALNGKVYIHGGGWDTILAPVFPTTIARIALVFMIAFEPLELQQAHLVTVRLQDQDGQPFGDIEAKTYMQPAQGPFGTLGSATFATQVVTIEQRLVFPGPGSYRFKVWVGDDNEEPLASVPLHVVPLPVPPQFPQLPQQL